MHKPPKPHAPARPVARRPVHATAALPPKIAPTPNVAQPKTAPAPPARRTPSAPPPAYRPQPKPVVLQRKSALPAPHPAATAPRPAAPAVNRPGVAPTSTRPGAAPHAPGASAPPPARKVLQPHAAVPVRPARCARPAAPTHTHAHSGAAHNRPVSPPRKPAAPRPRAASHAVGPVPRPPVQAKRAPGVTLPKSAPSAVLPASAHKQKVVQRLTPAAAPAPRPEVIQMLSAKVTISGGRVTSASIGGSAPATNLRGKRGDHTTPYTSFEAMAKNNVIGYTVAGAAKNLRITLQRIKNFPGFLKAATSYKKSLTAYANKWINYANSLVTPDKYDIQTLMEAVVTLRNAIPFTAYKNKKSTGGHGEASKVGGLDWAEYQVRQGTWTQKTDFTGNPMQNVWDTFDFGAPGVATYADWAEMLNQHMLSMKESFPRMFDTSGIYTVADMKHYLVNTVLSAQFSVGAANSIKALL